MGFRICESFFVFPSSVLPHPSQMPPLRPNQACQKLKQPCHRKVSMNTTACTPTFSTPVDGNVSSTCNVVGQIGEYLFSPFCVLAPAPHVMPSPTPPHSSRPTAQPCWGCDTDVLAAICFSDEHTTLNRRGPPTLCLLPLSCPTSSH